jgi:hypothetical protein
VELEVEPGPAPLLDSVHSFVEAAAAAETPSPPKSFYFVKHIITLDMPISILLQRAEAYVYISDLLDLVDRELEDAERSEK